MSLVNRKDFGCGSSDESKKRNYKMHPAIFNKEVLNCDLDRVRTSIASSLGGIKPTNLRIIEDKYNNVLRKQHFSPTNFEVDDNAVKICRKDDIEFQGPLKPIRHVLYIDISLFQL